MQSSKPDAMYDNGNLGWRRRRRNEELICMQRKGKKEEEGRVGGGCRPLEESMPCVSPTHTRGLRNQTTTSAAAAALENHPLLLQVLHTLPLQHLRVGH